MDFFFLIFIPPCVRKKIGKVKSDKQASTKVLNSRNFKTASRADEELPGAKPGVPGLRPGDTGDGKSAEDTAENYQEG